MFFDNFKALCDQKGVSPKRAVTEMGLSNSIATKWKKTGATPNSETLVKIAGYFEVPLSSLLGEEQEKPAPSGDGLDRELIEIWSTADEAERADLLNMARMLKSRRK